MSVSLFSEHGGTSVGGTTVTIGLTSNSKAGRWVIVNHQDGNDTVQTAVGALGVGTVWHHRGTTPTTNGNTAECWYADVPSNWVTGNLVLTYTPSTLDDSSWFAMFFTNNGGAGYTIGFDSYINWPVAILNTGEVSISTNSTAPYVFVTCGHNNASNGSGVVPASLALLDTQNNTGGSLEQYANLYGGLPGQLNNTTLGYGSLPGNPTSVYMDAVVENAPAPQAAGLVLLDEYGYY